MLKQLLLTLSSFSFSQNIQTFQKDGSDTESEPPSSSEDSQTEELADLGDLAEASTDDRLEAQEVEVQEMEVSLPPFTPDLTDEWQIADLVYQMYDDFEEQ